MKTHFSLLLALAFQSPLRSEPLPTVTLDERTIGALGITASPVTPQRVADPVTATAHVGLDPARTRSVATFFSGQIARDLVQAGQTVEAGQPLAVLKSREVAEALTRWVEADSKLASARQIYERERELRPQQLTTEDDFLVARAAYQEARAQQTAALQKALFARSLADLEALRDSESLPDLTEITMTSPITGTIIQKSAYAGDAVEPNSELFEVADLTSLLIEIQVPLKAASFLQTGDSVEFHTVVGEPRKQNATVERLESTLNPQALTVQAFARLDQAEGPWIVGTPVQVHLFDSDLKAAPAVPRTALVTIADTPHLFLSQGNKQFQPIAVSLGRTSQTLAEITSALPTDAQVVGTGANLLLAAWEDATDQ
jgi:cobalt-zinc-cadmium efflux system membrane fusion protein